MTLKGLLMALAGRGGKPPKQKTTRHAGERKKLNNRKNILS